MKLSPQQLLQCAVKYRGDILLFVLVVFLTHLEGNIAMLAGEGFGVWAFVLLLILVIRSISWFLKRSDEKAQRLKKTSFRFLYAAILCAISWQGIQYINHKISRDFAPLIAKLEAYKTEHGEYPKTQEAFASLVPQLPKCGIVPFSYGYHNSDGKVYICSGEQNPHCLAPQDPNAGLGPNAGVFYSLTCMTYGFNHHTYSSGSRKWSDHD